MSWVHKPTPVHELRPPLQVEIEGDNEPKSQSEQEQVKALPFSEIWELTVGFFAESTCRSVGRSGLRRQAHERTLLRVRTAPELLRRWHRPNSIVVASYAVGRNRVEKARLGQQQMRTFRRGSAFGRAEDSTRQKPSFWSVPASFASEFEGTA